MRTTTIASSGRVLRRVGDVLLALGAIGAVVAAIAIIGTAVASRNHLGAAFQGVLWAGGTICAATALRVAGGGLAKRAGTDRSSGQGAS